MRRMIVVAAAATVGMLSGASIVWAVSQPHMENALHALENARYEIGIADQARDHGGHAGAATNLIDQAIGEVRAGIGFRNAHP
jgi:hypothetical protein